jgi:hypothetical protein
VEPTNAIGSTGLIEIAIKDGDAAAAMGLERGTPVVLRTVVRR